MERTTDIVMPDGLAGLAFEARRAVQGLYAGGHASPRIGHGVEFHDYRAYSAGDDPRGIDWKLYGRTDRLHVRRHLHHSDMDVYVMVDATASMEFSGIGVGRGDDAASKRRAAQVLAAAIGFLTIHQGDRAGVGLFDRGLTAHLPPGGTWEHWARLCATLEAANGGAQGEGDVGEALRQAHRLMRRRGMVVFIGDLLDEPGPLLEGLSRLRHRGFDVVVFQILHSQELSLAGFADARWRLVDGETRRGVSADVAQVRAEYEQAIRRHIGALRRGFSARGIDYALARADRPAGEVLREFLMGARGRRR